MLVAHTEGTKGKDKADRAHIPVVDMEDSQEEYSTVCMAMSEADR